MQPKLSTKLIADYTELANNYLDKLPVNEPKDFEVIKKVLTILLEKNEVVTDIKGLKGRVDSLKEIIDRPDMFAKPEHQELFKTIVKSRISSKINEIENLSEKGKKQQIENLKAQRAKAKEDHEHMSQFQSPEIGSESHTVTYTGEGWNREMEDRFNQSANQFQSANQLQENLNNFFAGL